MNNPLTYINPHFAIFSSHFDRDKGLDHGRFALCSLTRGVIDIWVAASSFSTKQYKESFHERGGYLPPTYRCPGLKFWEIETSPVDLRGVKGVAGNFYRLLPHAVTTDKGGKRSDFGVHLDANVPGSMGCIVMDARRFKQFENQMKLLNQKGTKKIKLLVFYS